MTGPFYSSGPIVNITLGASNVTDFITQFRDTLISTNWTLISAFVGFGGTPGYILKSYPTPIVQNRIQLKIWYAGDLFGGTYPQIRILISDENGANEQVVGYIMIENDLGNKTLRCICGPHQFFIFIDSTIPPNQLYTARFNAYNNVMGGCPHVVNTIHSQVFWGLGDAGHQRTFRDNLAGGGNDYFSFLINGFIPWTAGFPDSFGNTENVAPTLLSQRSANLHSNVTHFDGNFPVIEPLCFVGRAPNSYFGVYLWDAIVVGNRFPTKILSSADSRTWESFTLSPFGPVVGSLFLVTNSLIGQTVGSYSH